MPLNNPIGPLTHSPPLWKYLKQPFLNILKGFLSAANNEYNEIDNESYIINP